MTDPQNSENPKPPEQKKPQPGRGRKPSQSGQAGEMLSVILKMIWSEINAFVKKLGPKVKSLVEILFPSGGEPDQTSTPVSRSSATKETSGRQPDKTFNIKEVGYYLDGWAELIENMGEKCEFVQDKVWASLARRGLPESRLSSVNAYDSNLIGKLREYFFIQMHPGITTTVRITQLKEDLFVSWSTYIRLVLNWATILGMLIFAGLMAFLAGSMSEYSDTSSFWGYLVSRAAPSVVIATFILFLIFELFVITSLGRFLKGSSLAYFFVEPTYFNAEDISIVNLAVHKTLLRSLDEAEIDTSKLRLKETFKRGRRGEEI